MSSHRLHYLDMRPEPAQMPPRRPDAATLLGAALLFLFLSLYAVHYVVVLAPRPAPAAAQPAPVPAAAAPSQTVEDARIEGFQAGFAAALEQGCRHPASLANPLGAI